MNSEALPEIDTSAEDGQNSFFERALAAAASIDRFGMGLLRLGLVIVLVWIGGLKFASYEADSTVPLVSNSPLMSFFYHHPAPEYHHYVNREGELSRPIANGTGAMELITFRMHWVLSLCRSPY